MSQDEATLSSEKIKLVAFPLLSYAWLKASAVIQLNSKILKIS